MEKSQENQKGIKASGMTLFFSRKELGCTAAELERQKKNNLSHRANALKDLIREIDGKYTS